MSEPSLTEPEPFSLPLSRAAFREALRRGQGRAALHVESYGASGVEDLILDATAFDRVYDAQCEPSRTDWLVELVDAAGLEARAALEVIRLLDARDAADTSWDLEQRCDLAAIFARRGHDGARAALYRTFRKSDHFANLIGGDQIVDLDGAGGLTFVAQRIGEMYMTGAADSQYGELMTRFDERHGEKTAELLLASIAEHDPRVATFLARQQVHPFDQTKSDASRRTATLPASAIIEQLDKNGRRILSAWGQKASDEDLRVIAEHMFREQNPDRLEQLISAFQRRAMPKFDPRLLQFADHPSKDVRGRAIMVLANYSADEVRSLALVRATAGRISDGEIELFRLNYVAGDWRDVISRYCQLPQDTHVLHGFLGDLLKLFEKSEASESLAPLLIVYEHTPCSSCREDALEALMRQQAAPAWVIEECRRDCVPEVRALAAAKA